jgi:hypothetical protein
VPLLRNSVHDCAPVGFHCYNLTHERTCWQAAEDVSHPVSSCLRDWFAIQQHAQLRGCLHALLLEGTRAPDSQGTQSAQSAQSTAAGRLRVLAETMFAVLKRSNMPPNALSTAALVVVQMVQHTESAARAAAALVRTTFRSLQPGPTRPSRLGPLRRSGVGSGNN